MSPVFKNERMPVVAGHFYPSDKVLLKDKIRQCFTNALGPGNLPELNSNGKREIIGMMLPHAGYDYAGVTASWGYSEIAKDGFPETFLIIGPNHNAYGADIAVSKQPYITPLGKAEIDMPFVKALSDEGIVIDDKAHSKEHSIEVQIPFMQFINQNFKIVTIALKNQSFEATSALGKTIRKVIDKTGRDTVIIASSDMTHYNPKNIAIKKDRLAINHILNLDIPGLYASIKKYGISMCGYGPVSAIVSAFPDTKPKLVNYTTSGDFTASNDVVGYASIEFRR